MKKKGFTLIELIAVIIILAIIALIAIPMVFNVIEDSKKSAGESEANMVLKGITDYCEQEKMGISKTTYCKDETTLKENLDKIVNLGKINKDSINLVLDENKKITYLALNSNGKNFELNNGMMELMSAFSSDSWDEIQNNIKNGTTDMYKIGDTKIITLNNNSITYKEKENINLVKTFKVRIANKSTPTECTDQGFSQTACGFVIEFVDVIANYKMYETRDNIHGWPGSEIYEILNNETNSIYSVLPEELKNIIIDTYTVSSGRNDSFTSDNNLNKKREKLYLFSPMEVLNEKLGNNYDTSELKTRQLDFYRDNRLISEQKMYESAIKKGRGNTGWWTRSAHSYSDTCFFSINTNGKIEVSFSNEIKGIAPAFRIG